MEFNDTLGGRARYGTVAECTECFQQTANKIRSAGAWVSDNLERNDKTVTLFNLLSASADYLDLAAENIEEHISLIALATRNLYEINLQTCDILRSPDSLLRWLGEAVTDKIEVLEGVLSLKTGDAKIRAVLRTEIERLSSLREKHDLPNARPSSAVDIAKSLGRGEEHKALYKLFSKLVHPSSYFVNDYKNAASDEVRTTLQLHAQFYAWDTFGRICDEVMMPEQIRKKIETSSGL